MLYFVVLALSRACLVFYQYIGLGNASIIQNRKVEFRPKEERKAGEDASCRFPLLLCSQLLKLSGVILLQVMEGEAEEAEMEAKMVRSLYSEEDGQLSWFNAGVRVGVGIGLGMCLGLGLGVGLLMHSYQATTRNFKRRFF